METNKYFLIIILFLWHIIGAFASDLQEMVNVAYKEGKTVELDGQEVYVLEKPLRLYDGITINGNGAIITQSLDWNQRNGKYEPLIRIVNVKNVLLNNIIFDHDAINNLRAQPSNTILMFGAQNCEITNCTFKNLGFTYSLTSVKGSPFILILSQEAANDFSYLPIDLINKKYQTINNRIDHCKFINEKTYISFAVRLLTLWTKNRKTQEISNRTANNTISNCEFLGEYDWNTIELAGPGTLYNTVKGNLIRGKSLNNIDVDKGASFNKIIDNTILDSGLPARHFGRKDVRFAAIAIHGSNENLLNYNNLVERNTIEKIIIKDSFKNQYIYASGIMLIYTENTIIRNNSLNNLFDKNRYGIGILMDQSNKNLKIEDNKITNVYRGIFESLNSRLNLNPAIKNNSVKAVKRNVFLK